MVFREFINIVCEGGDDDDEVGEAREDDGDAGLKLAFGEQDKEYPTWHQLLYTKSSKEDQIFIAFLTVLSDVRAKLMS